MNRREVLGSIMIGAAMLPASQLKNSPLLLPNNNPVFHVRRASSRQFEIFTISGLFVTFVTSVVSAIASRLVNEWIDDLIRQRQEENAREVQNWTNFMIRSGFIDSDFSEVNLLNGGTFAYPMITEDGFNACAPFLDSHTYNKNALVEGPSLGALGVIANDYNTAQQNSGVTPNAAAEETGTLLIPRAELQIPSHQRFNSSFNREAVYSTDGGELHINYERHSQEFAGRVTSYVVPNNRRRQTIQFEPVVIEFQANMVALKDRRNPTMDKPTHIQRWKLIIVLLSCFAFVLTSCSPNANSPGGGGRAWPNDRRIVVVPVNNANQVHASYRSQAGDCVIYVREATGGIYIYPYTSPEPDGSSRVGIYRYDDGPQTVQVLMRDSGNRYTWGKITVRGVTGWVHVGRPWTEDPGCTLNPQPYNQFAYDQRFYL